MDYIRNEWKALIVAAGVCLAVFVVLLCCKKALGKRAGKEADGYNANEAQWGRFILNLIQRTKLYFIFSVSLYAGSLALDLPLKTSAILAKGIILIALFQISIWGTMFIDLWIENAMKRKMEQDRASTTTVAMMSMLIRVAFYALLVLLALNNLGVNITALVAGLGVGGIAIALAVQNILGDLFASLTIVMDKPFVVDDFIVVGDFAGSIEKIGLKTTRIRSLSGEQLIFPNADLLQSRLRNYKRMRERRVLFLVQVTYQTSHEKLQEIPNMIRKLVEAEGKSTRFDRCHFSQYGEFSLNFETVYWVNSSDYNFYMDVHQKINLGIFKKFEEEGIEFAYPTRTVFVQHAEPESPEFKESLPRA